jgi:protein phosphatase
MGKGSALSSFGKYPIWVLVSRATPCIESNPSRLHPFAIPAGEYEPLKHILPEIESSGLSVMGPVREDNQDAIRLAEEGPSAHHGLLYAIADGMGGYAHGGLASQMALETFHSILASHNGNSIPRVMQRAVEAANLKIYQKAQQLGAGRIGTTLTAAYVFNDMLYLAHVGDSRAYLIRDGEAICLTDDHTTVGDMVRAKLIPARNIRTHAQRSILTKSVGLDLFVQPDIIQYKLKEGDRLVLCTDGLWSVVEDDELTQILNQSQSTEVASRNLIELALQHQSDDNVSVVVFHLHKFVPVSTEHSSHMRRSTNWFQNLWKVAT